MILATAALVRERGGSVAPADVRLRAVDPDDVLVRIAASGVCPTDLYAIDGGAGLTFPSILGHEGAGVVEAVGDAVTEVHVGDRVVLGFASCGACAPCRGGHPASCARFGELNSARTLGTETLDGEPVETGWMAQSSWATHVVVHRSAVAVVADDVPWPVAAALGCGVLTGAGTVLNVLRPGRADHLLVIGAGTTGLSAVMAAAHRGVGTISVSDPDPRRRALAQELGATAAFTPDEVAAALRRTAPTSVVDTVGSPETLALAAGLVAIGGTAATVALKPGANPVTVSQSRLLWDRTLRGVIEGDAVLTRDVPMLAALWRAGRLPVERIITEYAFDAVTDAVTALRTGTAIKPVLLMDDAASAVVERAQRDETPTPDLLTALRSSAIPPTDLPALWRTLPPVRPDELRGLWRGFGIGEDHAAARLLTRSRWFGKLFRSDDDVLPLVCTAADGGLFSAVQLAGGAGASLREAVHEGVTTAAMIYDARPIVDLFTRLTPDAVLGVMTGRGALDHGRAYYFVLERTVDRAVAEPEGP